MISRLLTERFARWREAEHPLVLATVIETRGSTYRKAGAQMLLTPEGQFEGLLSGGCLEGDLVEHGRAVLAEGRARTVTYDLSDPEADELWGLGLGCQGITTVMLQPLLPEEDYLPFGAVEMLARSRTRGAQLLVTESRCDTVTAGASLVWGGSTYRIRGMDANVADELVRTTRDEGRDLDRVSFTHRTAGGDFDVFAMQVHPPPRLVLLGGGPDALPVFQLADRLGWDCVVCDHRPAYTGRLRGSGVRTARDIVPGEPLPAGLLEGACAVVIMSHHLTSDQHHLRAAAASDAHYVGLLGPAARRERLLEQLDAHTAARLEGRLRAPVGLDIGGEGPEAIALAIVAEVQAAMSGHAGGSLSAVPGERG